MFSLQLILVKAAGIEMEDRSRRAAEACDSALEALTVKVGGLSPGGSFTLAPDNKLNLSACSANWCDEYRIEESSGENGNDSFSIAGGNYWGDQLPYGIVKLFVRRWRIDTVPNYPDLREITVAVLTNSESTTPLALQTTRISIRTP